MAIKYPGKDGLVYASTSSAGALTLVGGLREFTIDNSVETIDTTEFGATNRTSVQGFPASRGTFGGHWASDDTTMRQASQSTDGCYILIYPSRNATAKSFTGPVFVDMSMRSAIDSSVGVTYNWAARGNMTNNL